MHHRGSTPPTPWGADRAALAWRDDPALARAGVAAKLPKPIDADRLRALLRKLLAPGAADAL